MLNQIQTAHSDPAQWLAQWRPLSLQLGSAEGLQELALVSSTLLPEAANDLARLDRFLRKYQKQLLLARELPMILAAYGHASRLEVRELLRLDSRLAADAPLAEMALASRTAGRGQLERLRPLRDQRVVQRYLRATESGQAHGWHTLVYGLTLFVFSLPLHQALQGYAQQSIAGLICSAARASRLPEQDCRELFDRICASLPEAITGLLHDQQITVAAAS